MKTPHAVNSNNSDATIMSATLMFTDRHGDVVVHELKREVSIEQAEREAEEGVARALGGLQIR